MLTDSHAHLSCAQIAQDIDAVLARASQAGVKTILNIATTAAELTHALELYEKYPWVFPAGATTPHDVSNLGEKEFPFFAQAAFQKKLVAIGETGLDYHYKHSDPKTQQAFCRRYLHLALETELPIIIHCRDAFEDLFALLDSDYTTNGKHAPGVLHCFTGTLAEASEVLKRGWYLSLSGIVTFKKCGELKEVAKMVPLENLLIETDAPYLTPTPYRSKQNEPSYLVETAKVIADLRNISLEELGEATTKNAFSFLNIAHNNEKGSAETE